MILRVVRWHDLREHQTIKYVKEKLKYKHETTVLRKSKCEQGLYISNNIVFFFKTKILFPSLHEFRFLSLNFLKKFLQNSSDENMDDEKNNFFSID